MKYQRTKWAKNTAVSPWIGTMRGGRCIYPCQDMCKRRSNDSNMNLLPRHKTSPIHIPPQLRREGAISQAQGRLPPIGKEGKRYIQQVTGTFLFYARAVNGTMLTALSAMASEQDNPTEATMKKCKQFLGFAASQEEAISTFRASDMVLAIHSNASYLSEPKSRSRAEGHHFLDTNNEQPKSNGAVLYVSHIIKAVM